MAQLVVEQLLQDLEVTTVLHLAALDRVQHQFAHGGDELGLVLPLQVLTVLVEALEFGQQVVVAELLLLRPALGPEPVALKNHSVDVGEHEWQAQVLDAQGLHQLH